LGSNAEGQGRKGSTGRFDQAGAPCSGKHIGDVGQKRHSVTGRQEKRVREAIAEWRGTAGRDPPSSGASDPKQSEETAIGERKREDTGSDKDKGLTVGTGPTINHVFVCHKLNHFKKTL